MRAMTLPVLLVVATIATDTRGQFTLDIGELSPAFNDEAFSLGSLQDADASEAVPPIRHSSLITLRPQIWFPSIEGSMSLEDDLGFSTSLDIEDDLNADKPDAEFSWEVDVLLGWAFLRFSGYGFESSELQTANQTITFGDVEVNVGDLFDASIEVDNLKVQLGWSILNAHDHGITLALTVGLDWYQIEASITDATTLLNDAIDEDLPVPIIGVHLEVPIDRFLIAVDISGLSIEVEDIDVSYLDFSAGLTWMPIDHVGVFAGYRMIEVDLDSADFTLDTEIAGPFFGVEIRF